MTFKEQKELRSIRNRQQEISTRLSELSDTIQKENRSLNEAERKETESLSAERDALNFRAMRIENPINAVADTAPSKEEVTAKVIRSMASNKGVPDDYKYLRAQDDPSHLLIPTGETVYKMRRADTVQNLASVEPIVPITVKDIIEPLEKGLILNTIGAHVQTGIVGQWNFPVVAGVEADWADENVEISDKEIELSKITPSPKRLAISVPVSNTAIWQSAGAIRPIVTRQISLAIQRTLNKTMFSLSQIGEAGKVPAGCFVNTIASEKITSASAAVTYAEINSLRAAVESTGVQLEGAAFVCPTALYYELASTPKDAGSGRFIIENGMIDGTPVFRTEYIDANTLGYGMFGYEMVGQFGDMSLSIDSNSAAVSKKNLTYFVLNSNWDLTALRQEAFGYLTVNKA